MSARRRVAVLGATGAVGQAFIRLLARHPWFELAELAASERSAGKRYGEAARWLGGELPAEIAAMPVLACDPSVITSELVFSALDSSVAGEAEADFARAGHTVVSNAKNHRMEPDVPLVIAEVNPEHMALLDTQRAKRGWEGAIVTNGNCSTIALVSAVAPLHRAFGIRRMVVVTMQALSGAGYPGVPSLDALGNVIPFIRDEEEKIEEETRKFLGALDGSAVRLADTVVAAQTNRVPVENGHTVCVSMELEQRATPEQAREALRAWRGSELARGLPTSPERPIILRDEPDRPQPRRDVDAGHGMSTVVGRVREDPVLGLRLVAMAHNVVRGAAGAAVQNAELLVATGRLGTA
ncbi:MAG TPA: aspartate-semialdehyde dehydrogenase [Gemmatimonadaceae bacterium]|nr:aspartate-semialdehyde dehydrogenase [Gemmatimonadaceae bacterium]